MSIKHFEDGSVLYTGEDMLRQVLGTGRNNYAKSCAFCAHEDSDSCEECSMLDTDSCCSCHIVAPCSYCVENHFEPSPHLINYQHCQQGKRRWEYIRGTEESVEKLSQIESAGFKLAAETLTTGEISITVEGGEFDYEIELCNKNTFTEAVLKIIDSCDIEGMVLKKQEENNAT